ncbi:hypothetical protein AB0N05_09985 [Nocardia sp. NPDC051030]
MKSLVQQFIPLFGWAYTRSGLIPAFLGMAADEFASRWRNHNDSGLREVQ